MEPWTITLTRSKGASTSVSVLKLALLAPALLVAAAVLLQAGPWNQWPAEPEPSGYAEVVPLNARDPASLVMSPYWGQCKCECPSISKPR